MKVLQQIAVTGAIGAQVSVGEASVTLPLRDLDQVGMNPAAVRQLYYQHTGVQLSWDKVLKVSADEEGKEISFDSFDGISVVVPADASMASPNKGPESAL